METIIAAQLPRKCPKEKPALAKERQFGWALKRQFGRGQLRVKTCRETVGSQLLPRGIQMSCLAGGEVFVLTVGVFLLTVQTVSISLSGLVHET